MEHISTRLHVFAEVFFFPSAEQYTTHETRTFKHTEHQSVAKLPKKHHTQHQLPHNASFDILICNRSPQTEAWKRYTKFHTQHKVKGQLANAQSSLCQR